MNFLQIILMTAALAAANIAVYRVFADFFSGKQNAGMMFLLVNISKDVLWSIAWLAVIEKTRGAFLVFTGIFAVLNFILYFFVIKKLNRE